VWIVCRFDVAKEKGVFIIENIQYGKYFYEILSIINNIILKLDNKSDILVINI